MVVSLPFKDGYSPQWLKEDVLASWYLCLILLIQATNIQSSCQTATQKLLLISRFFFYPSFCKTASVTHSLSSNGTSSLCLTAAGASVEPDGFLPVRSCWRRGGQQPSLISFRVSISLFSGAEMLIQTIQSLTMPINRQSVCASAEFLHFLLHALRLKPLKQQNERKL